MAVEAGSTLEAEEIARGIGAIALIGAILGLAGYVYRGVTGEPTESEKVWLYLAGGAALALCYAMFEWLVRTIAEVADWRKPGHPPWKRTLGYALLAGAAIAVLYGTFLLAGP